MHLIYVIQSTSPIHSSFAYYSPMSMHYCQQGKVNPTTYVVSCKECSRSIPVGTQEFPCDNKGGW
jgi:hypothetical protein